MVECDLRRYFKTKENPSSLQISDIQESVESGINLNQGLGGNTTHKVREEMLREIAVSTYYASDFLNNSPWPNFGLTHAWGTQPSEKHKNNNRVILADASVDANSPYGLICFSPDYLSAIADFKMGRFTLEALTHGNANPLSKITAHENYHIFQYSHFPKTMEKQTEVAVSLDLSEWEKTRAERSARIFEDFFNGASSCNYSMEHV